MVSVRSWCSPPYYKLSSARLFSTCLIRPAVGRNALPLRTPVRFRKKKAKDDVKPTLWLNPNYIERMVPYIPNDVIHDIVPFFASDINLRSLLTLVYSPAESMLTTDDKREYELERQRFESAKLEDERKQRIQEQVAERKMFEAIENLPADYYYEAIASEIVPIPHDLKFHTMYQSQIRPERLCYWEMRLLQTYYNLMHLRYPFWEHKKMKPELYWLAETHAVSRQRQIAAKLASYKLKKAR
eukprot:Platyproteum_vivax@DN15601_c0_g1_i1.p1